MREDDEKRSDNREVKVKNARIAYSQIQCKFDHAIH
jgi:hypothetical protein